MKKKIKLALVFLSGIAACCYAYCWYFDTPIQAWHALIWCWFAFWNDLEDYNLEHQ